MLLFWIMLNLTMGVINLSYGIDHNSGFNISIGIMGFVVAIILGVWSRNE